MNPINKAIVGFVKLLPKPIVYKFAKKYIAGQDIESAVKLVKQLNSKGIVATMDVLGEAISTREEALQAKELCLQTLRTIHAEKLNSNLSIKPTQFGLMLDEEFAYQQVKEVVELANQLNNFVRLDMEDSGTTDKILNLYRRLRNDYFNLGVVLQAYMRRTPNDVTSLGATGSNYRLCKGIYIEPEEIAFKEKQEIRDNYMRTLELMLTSGRYVGIATHDEYLVDESLKLIKRLNISKGDCEFQMLLGVREDLRDKINALGYKVRIYVPYGKDWYLYSIRRLKENPQVAGHIAKNFFGIK